MLLPMFPAYYIFNSLLILLLALHLVWTWLILQVAYKAIRCGQVRWSLYNAIIKIPREETDYGYRETDASNGFHNLAVCTVKVEWSASCALGKIYYASLALCRVYTACPMIERELGKKQIVPTCILWYLTGRLATLPLIWARKRLLITCFLFSFICPEVSHQI